jgi:hypothetical protein
MRQLKPGLVFATMHVEVQDVTERHVTPCAGCGVLPPGPRRLALKLGSGRGQECEVYCAKCGTRVLWWLRLCATKAVSYLYGKRDSVRDVFPFAVQRAARRKQKELRRAAKRGEGAACQRQ